MFGRMHVHHGGHDRDCGPVAAGGRRSPGASFTVEWDVVRERGRGGGRGGGGCSTATNCGSCC